MNLPEFTEDGEDGIHAGLPRGMKLFETTRWALVRRAAVDTGALGEWLGLYWSPLYHWARKRGQSPEDAADGVQSFLEKLCANELLVRVDAARGRFRAWLLTAFANHLATLRTHTSRNVRGGNVCHVVIDWSTVETAYLMEAGRVNNPDALYARTWALTVLEEALDRVTVYYQSTGRSDLFETLLPVLEAPLPDVTYAETASHFGMTAAAFRQAAVRLRNRFRSSLLDIASVRLGISDPAALEEELRALLSGHDRC